MGKSQVTVFIVLGMLIVAVATLLIYLQSVSYDDLDVDVKDKYVVKSSLEPVKMYIESCLDQSARRPIEIIGKRGGELEPSEYTYHEKNKLNYLCVQRGDEKCINSVLRKEEIEHELSEAIEKNVRECINLDIFRKQGFQIQEGELDVQTTIGLQKIEVKANYPLLFSKNSTNLKIEKFSTKLFEPLGMLYFLATDIVNIEITKGNFDQVDFMRNDGVSVLIEKHRPYPDTVYQLKRNNYSFNFAMEGKDTVSNIGYSFDEEDRNYGCCYIEYDNNCYKNVPRVLCEENGGLFDPNSACKCPIIEPAEVSTCQGDECDDCDSTYNPVADDYSGEARLHGESWCTYEGIAGDGKDLVGSRHYLHYCIDGKEYVEECRDYREELCTQGSVIFDGENISNAVCRPNRWESCQSCETESCCENSEYRDCMWNGESCVPEVPPGFRFWEGNGADVCSIASSEKKCNGFSCGEEWVTETAEKCLNSGDCGNYRNIEGDLTEDGFYHTNLQNKVNDRIYGTRQLTEDNTELDLDPNTINEADLMESSSKKGANNFMDIISSAYSFMDQLEKMSLSGVEDGKVDNVKVKNIGICGVWKAPKQGDCSKCNSNEMRPCTEYMCKSLGKNCIYEEKKGTGHCHEIVKDDLSAPVIELNKSRLNPEYSVETKSIMFNDKQISGYKVREGLNPFDVLKFGITTEQETICRMSYMPRSSIIDTKGHYVGQGFSRQHEIALPVPPKPELPKKLLDFMNSTNASSFLQKLQEASGKDSIKNVLKAILGQDAFEDGNNFVKLFTSGVDEYRAASELMLNKIEEGGYYIFFYCENKAGMVNKDNFFLEVDIIENELDEAPPGVKGFKPENGGKFSYNADSVDVELFLNEPATCKFSFNEESYASMNETMDCDTSRYDISGEFGGSYRCSAALPANDSIRIFIKCKDNPVRLNEVAFELHKGITNVTRLKLNDEVIENNYLEFNNNLTIDYFMDNDQECSLTYSPGRKEEGECSLANDMELGQYKCSFSLDLNNTNSSNVSVNILCSQETNQRNTNEQAFVYELEKADKLDILDFGPKGDIQTRRPLLYVETTQSRNVRCGYYRELNLGTVMMDNMAEYKFSAILDNVSIGSNDYFVTCRDDYGNQINKEIEFYVQD